jgi:uncharacterized protein (TIGR02452 family)
MVLNLADDQFPGGCVSTGSGAQKESLFRRTNYCMSLNFENDLYPISQDEAIYSPSIGVFRSSEKEDYEFIEQPFQLDFIACPGLKHSQLVYNSTLAKKHLSESDAEILVKKIRMILQVGVEEDHDSMVVGALGCGAWGNPPADVAAIFRRVLSEHDGVFKVIVFAILSVTDFDTANWQIFKDGLDEEEQQRTFDSRPGRPYGSPTGLSHYHFQHTIYSIVTIRIGHAIPLQARPPTLESSPRLYT